MSLNKGSAGGETASGTSDRHRLLADILGELVALRPERMGTFRALHRGSLSLIHAHLVMLLDRDGPLSMGQIAELLDVSVASATGIVDRLEKRGLAARRRDEADRRVVLVDPTEQARALMAEMEREHRDALRAVLEELTDDELAGFLSALRAMHRARERYLVEHGIVVPPADRRSKASR